MFKRGQVGETMTWFVATLIIIGILLIFILVASALSSSRGVKKDIEKKIFEFEGVDVDLFMQKIIFTYWASGSSEREFIQEALVEGGKYPTFDRKKKELKRRLNR